MSNPFYSIGTLFTNPDGTTERKIVQLTDTSFTIGSNVSFKDNINIGALSASTITTQDLKIQHQELDCSEATIVAPDTMSAPNSANIVCEQLIAQDNKIKITDNSLGVDLQPNSCYTKQQQITINTQEFRTGSALPKVIGATLPEFVYDYNHCGLWAFVCIPPEGYNDYFLLKPNAQIIPSPTFGMWNVVGDTLALYSEQKTISGVELKYCELEVNDSNYTVAVPSNNYPAIYPTYKFISVLPIAINASNNFVAIALRVDA